MITSDTIRVVTLEEIRAILDASIKAAEQTRDQAEKDGQGVFALGQEAAISELRKVRTEIIKRAVQARNAEKQKG